MEREGSGSHGPPDTAAFDEHIQAALARRLVIGQAQGILMERMGLTPERAHAFLKRISQHTNVKLYEVAAQIVETRIIPRGDLR